MNFSHSASLARPSKNWWPSVFLSLLLHGFLFFVILFALGPRGMDLGSATRGKRIGRSGDGSRTVVYCGQKFCKTGQAQTAENTSTLRKHIDPHYFGPNLVEEPQRTFPLAKEVAPAPLKQSQVSSSGNSTPKDQKQAGAGSLGQNPKSARGASFFGISTPAKRIVYVLDRSMSMGRRDALDVAANELLASLETLPQQVRFQIIVYNSRPEILFPERREWLTAEILDKQLVAQALRSLKAVGHTAHSLALAKALALAPEAIYFLTDADDIDPMELRRLSRQNNNGISVHMIVFNVGGVPTNSDLEGFANSNAGQFRAIDFQKWKR